MPLFYRKETGLKDLLKNKEIKNLVDYMTGVEAGLDSNARKNRGGHAMENILEAFILDLCKRKNLKYLKEANATKIKKEFSISMPVNKSSRRYDFVIKTKNGVYFFETNFYGGGGSKLDKTASDYRNLFDTLANGQSFIWITDGTGWKKAINPLRETFNHNDYVFSLSLLEKGILEEVIR